MWHERPNTQLVEPGDTAFWQTLWKTDAFRALLDDPRTGYAKILEQAARLPWWFVDSEQAYERRHFSVWFANTFIRRAYDNPAITDLFHWHDLLHAMTFRSFHPEEPVTDEQWRLAMRANEIAVSMETETIVYWRNPALRALAWPQPIWHDQLTNPLAPALLSRLRRYRISTQSRTPSAAALHEQALPQAVLEPWPLPYQPDPTLDRVDWQGLWELRRTVTLEPDLDNTVERDIARYESMADPFFFHWANDWREVEHERFVFQSLCGQGQWRQAVARRQMHWERVSNADGVPYGNIARALVPIGF